MATTAKKQSKEPFWLGGFGSCVAALFTHPLDLLKKSTDGKKLTLAAAATNLYRNEGPLAFYNGLSAALLRQGSYSTVRFGIYESLKPLVQDSYFEGKPMPLWGKIGLSGIAGAAGGLVGTPADVVNIRMQANIGNKDPKTAYKHALDGLVKLAREGGVQSLWRGVGPNTARAVLMTAAQIASYDQIKELGVRHLKMKDDLKKHFWSSVWTHFVCSTLAGIVATGVTSPFDVVKTRLMNADKGTYKNALQCGVQIVRHEGPLALYKGFLPSWTRLGPHTVITFLVLEQMRGLFQ